MEIISNIFVGICLLCSLTICIAVTIKLVQLYFSKDDEPIVISREKREPAPILRIIIPKD